MIANRIDGQVTRSCVVAGQRALSSFHTLVNQPADLRIQAKGRARMTVLCATHACYAEATVVAHLPAFPLNWEHPVCEQHLREILNPRTKLQYLNNDTIAVFVGEEQLGAD
jgi:hypothetical protein